MRTRSLVGLFVALPLLLIGQAVMSNNPIRWLFTLALVLFYGLLAVITLRSSNRAERFLAQNPEPGPEMMAGGV